MRQRRVQQMASERVKSSRVLDNRINPSAMPARERSLITAPATMSERPFSY